MQKQQKNMENETSMTVLNTQEIPQIQLEVSNSFGGNYLQKISIGVQGYDLEECHEKVKDLAILCRSLKQSFEYVPARKEERY